MIVKNDFGFNTLRLHDFFQLQGYAELYRGNLEQILFLLERNQAFATEEDTRRAILQQQILSYRRPLNHTSLEPSSRSADYSFTGPANQTENAKPSTGAVVGGLALAITLTSSLSSTEGDVSCYKVRGKRPHVFYFSLYLPPEYKLSSSISNHSFVISI